MQEIRDRVGENYPIMIKINVSDFMSKNRGLTEEEAIEVMKRLGELGVDLIETSGGNLSSGEEQATFKKGLHKVEEQSYFLNVAAAAASQTSSKICLVGGNKNFSRMTEILNSTEIQYFSMSRTLFCEPDLINRWREDQNYKPKCISCNHCWDTKPNACIFNR